ncbi:MAG: pyridoxal-phosphate dependent enzyme [Bacteroidota bacterium]
MQQLENAWLAERNIRLWVYRTDLREGGIAGNKWYKLKYNLIQAAQEGKTKLVTFGGAYSNHLHATAAAASLLGFQAVGFVRGDCPHPLNPTLRFARERNMELIFVSREAYRDKDALLHEHAAALGEYYLLPEGGSNQLALRGSAEMVEEVRTQLGGQLPDHWTVACGTGGTLAGLLCGLKGRGRVVGFSALKGDFMAGLVKDLLGESQQLDDNNWRIESQYHFGGYARHKPALIDFINDFYQQYGIPLDPIYNGKHFYGLFDQIKQGAFPNGSTILAIHSGGLQGIEGFNERYGRPLIRI